MDTRGSGGVMAGINVTPMADIMIVLLIIFMVMTPLIDRGQVRHLVYIKADEGLAYSEVRRVMDVCREAGAEEVALIARRRTGG